MSVALDAPPRRLCSVLGCGRGHFGLGYCQTHRSRFVKTGDPGPADIRVYGLPKPPCSVNDCREPIKAHGLCSTHYARVHRTGDVNRGMENRDFAGVGNPRWRGAEITYEGAHGRVRRERGQASDYNCAHCGGQAIDWAYDHADPDQRFGLVRDAWCAYSADPARYMPLCKSCHKKFDGPPPRLCDIDGCERIHYGKGMCQRHYHQGYRARRSSNGRKKEEGP